MSRICNNCNNQVEDGYDFCPYCGTVMENNSTEYECQLLPGRILKGRYAIGNVVGYGGFGITYGAVDNLMGTPVAIKEYYPFGVVDRDRYTGQLRLYKESDREEFMKGLDRFLGEARELVKFNNCPNVVSVLDFFTENDTAYMVMEFLDGQTLDEYIKINGGTLKEPMLTQTIFSVCEALEIVHNEGVIHRDISPDNIFICSDMTIKIIDFGAAKQFFATESKTVSVVLKHGYAPPEQYISKGKFGPWTDIYALGATLYKAVTGTLPEESVGRIVEDALVPPIELNPDIPQGLNDAILKAMAIKAPERYQSIEEFRNDLLGGVEEQNVEENVAEDIIEEAVVIAETPKKVQKEEKKVDNSQYTFKDKEKEKYIVEMREKDKLEKETGRIRTKKMVIVFFLILISVVAIMIIHSNRYYTLQEARLRIENDSKYSSIGISDSEIFEIERVVFFSDGLKYKTSKGEKAEIVDDGIYIKFRYSKRLTVSENNKVKVALYLKKLNGNDGYEPVGYGNLYIGSETYELDNGAEYDFVNGIYGCCLVDIGDLEPGRYKLTLDSIYPEYSADILFTVK
ncbi:MAG: zinc-ribbon domain-containing protein [Lachnospiraceae bacterium]|nr:zinc-ribbon domain-containing protein [Lachnospiraceae bacterium]